MWVNLYLIPIVIRVCLVVLFPFSALDKIVFWKDAVAQADSSFLPKSSGPPLLVAAIVVEAVAPFCIVFGWHDRLAAFVLALFCVVTAILYHPFWKFGDFWKSGKCSSIFTTVSCGPVRSARRASSFVMRRLSV